ncbi:MAG: terpene cyclase/mutase family protein [Planctomycetota bacterium]|nr:terpene cyclase/mutase family protein [Planctomycetota bacterium]
MANARMANSDHDSDLYVSFGLIDAPDSTLGTTAPSALRIVDLDSSEPLELPEETAYSAAAFKSGEPADTIPSGLAAGQLWLNGGVLMCACPDCRAPMSIRFWLMIADCWQCGTSIELSEEQEREARRLLAEQKKSTPAAAARSPSTQPPKSTRSATTAARESQALASSATPSQPKPQLRRDPPPPPGRGAAPLGSTRRPPPRRPVSALENRVRARLQKSARATGVTAVVRDLFGCTPAWLISLVFHLILLTLLALFTIVEEDEGPYITLSTTVAKEVELGGDTIVVDPLNEVVFDLPVPKDVNLSDAAQREAVVKADQDARELRIDPGADEPSLPELSQVKRMVGTATGGGQAVAARDPRIRVEVVKREGGTTLTEAAVARGLRWLAMHQEADGHWSLNSFNHSAGCSCSGLGGVQSDAAGTSLALLPFLGAGQTHLVGRYRDDVSRGLRWLLKNQREDGDLRANSQGNAGMYAHGQAAIVLCEAYMMTGDETLRDPAQRALDFIVAAQNDAGGWRYQPKQAGDTSVVGWQVMALQSGRAAKLNVPEETLALAGVFLDSVASSSGAKYAYTPGQGPTQVMTAEALLCRMYLGWKLDMPGIEQGVQFLVTNHLPSERAPNIYYWYYGTQALHHYGGDEWEMWNREMREILIKTQERRGHEAGSWDPAGDHASAGGRIYMTALATCSLEVYYRHLPIFRQIDLE